MLNPNRLRNALPEDLVLGRDLRLLETTASTNDVARELAASGEGRHGLVVYANEQSAGRGRRDAVWHAPPGSCLLHSILLEPGWPPTELGRIPLVAGLAVSRAIEKTLGIQPSIKWPNDLWIGQRKVGGILAESANGPSDQGRFLVLGIGLNLYVPEDQFPESLRASATSLASALRGVDAESIDPHELAAKLLVELEELLTRAAQDFGPLAKEIEHRMLWIGRPIICQEGNERVEGDIEGIGPHGELVIRQSDGSSRRLVHAFQLRPA